MYIKNREMHHTFGLYFSDLHDGLSVSRSRKQAVRAELNERTVNPYGIRTVYDRDGEGYTEYAIFTICPDDVTRNKLGGRYIPLIKGDFDSTGKPYTVSMNYRPLKDGRIMYYHRVRLDI